MPIVARQNHRDGSYEDGHVSISTAIEIQKTCREKPIKKLNTEALGTLVKPSRFGAKGGAMRLRRELRYLLPDNL